MNFPSGFFVFDLKEWWWKVLLDYVHKGLGGYFEELFNLLISVVFVLESHDKRSQVQHGFTWDVPNLTKVISL